MRNNALTFEKLTRNRVFGPANQVFVHPSVLPSSGRGWKDFRKYGKKRLKGDLVGDHLRVLLPTGDKHII